MHRLICPQCCQWIAVNSVDCPVCGCSIAFYMQNFSPQQISQHQQQLQQYLAQQKPQGIPLYQTPNSEQDNPDNVVPSPLIHCPDCGEKISVLSQSCPMCGRINPASSSSNRQFTTTYITQERSEASQACFWFGVLALALSVIFFLRGLSMARSSAFDFQFACLLLICSVILLLISFHLPSKYLYKTISREKALSLKQKF